MFGIDPKQLQATIDEMRDRLERIEKNQAEILKRLPKQSDGPGGK